MKNLTLIMVFVCIALCRFPSYYETQHWSINVILIVSFISTFITVYTDNYLRLLIFSTIGFLFFNSLHFFPFTPSQGFVLRIIINVVYIVFISFSILGLIIRLQDKSMSSKEIRQALIGGTWKIAQCNRDTPHANMETTTIIFKDNYTGECTDFYDMGKFSYKIRSCKFGGDWAKLKIYGTNGCHNFDIKLTLKERGRDILEIGEPNAFDDDIMGYTDPETGMFCLVIEPIYTFKKYRK